MPLNMLKNNLTATIRQEDTRNFLNIAVSTINECENDNMTAKIVNCLMVKSIETIAPIAAYKLSTFPKTKTIAASPGKPKTNIKGLNTVEIHPSIGVLDIMVIKK